jgi:hypothetical protein
MSPQQVLEGGSIRADLSNANSTGTGMDCALCRSFGKPILSEEELAAQTDRRHAAKVRKFETWAAAQDIDLAMLGYNVLTDVDTRYALIRVLKRGMNYDEWLAGATVQDVMARRVNMLGRCWFMDDPIDGVQWQCTAAASNANGTCALHETSDPNKESCFAASEQEAKNNPAHAGAAAGCLQTQAAHAELRAAVLTEVVVPDPLSCGCGRVYKGVYRLGYLRKHCRARTDNTDCAQTMAQLCVSPGRVFVESGGGVCIG